jgi:hypothetical protein
MRVVLDPTAFSQPLDLLVLLAACARAQHGLAAPIPARDTWLGTLGALAGPLGALFDALAARYTLHPAAAATITVRCAGGSNWPAAALEPGDAAALLAQPLELLVENERADFAFLRRIAQSHQRAQLDAAVAAGALRVRQGGGITEVKKSVEALRPQGSGPGEADRRVRRLRTVVLYDRDAQPADHRLPGRDATDLDQQLANPVANDPWPWWGHRLRRRHIESYVPVEVLEGWQKGAQNTGITLHTTQQHQAAATVIVALRRGSGAQRSIAHVLPMKGGLLSVVPKAQRNALPQLAPNAGAQQRMAVENAVTQAPGGAWPPPFDQLSPLHRADLLVGWHRCLQDVFSNADPQWDQSFWDEFDRDLDPTDPGDLAAHALVDKLLERL